jgi:hypothetical protein
MSAALATAAQETNFMNAACGTNQDVDDTFLRLVDFKWLMAGLGWWVSLTRLQSDTRYVDECLQRALSSDSALLRERSAELLRLLPRLHSSTTRRSDARHGADAVRIQNIALS